MKMNGYDKFFQQVKKTAVRPKETGKAKSPEDVVREHLAARIKSRRQEKRLRSRRSAKQAPVFASLMLLCSLAAGVTGYMNPDSMDGFVRAWNQMGLPRIQIAPLGQAVAQTPKSAPSESSAAAKTATPSSAEKSNAAGVAASGKSAEKAEANLDVSKWTPEELSFFKKLNDRKSELDRREAEIVKLEEELQKQREGIEEKIKQLEGMRKQISETLKGRVEQDQEKVAKLVDVYSNMKPTQASKIIETLNEDLAVSILDKMKKKNAAEILNTMAAAKARKLSEMLTGYRQPASVDGKQEATSEANSQN
jgi:flagellar motility protein MotE (MotC chaperone)